MTETTPTAAELDELQERLRTTRLPTLRKAADALRKQLDEARDDVKRWQMRCFAAERHMRDRDGDAIECGDVCQAEALRASNAQMAAALRDFTACFETFNGPLGKSTQGWDYPRLHKAREKALAALAQPAPASSEAHDERCNCEACIEARSRGPRYKGEGNTPMQKEDYDGSCQ